MVKSELKNVYQLTGKIILKWGEHVGLCAEGCTKLVWVPLAGPLDQIDLRVCIGS